MNRFLFITANENERTAFEAKFVKRASDAKKYIKSAPYYLGTFGKYPAAYIHIEEQGVTSPAAMPLVGPLIDQLRPAAVVMPGIAFGVDECAQKIGDVLVSDKILPYDSQRLKKNETEYKETPKEVGFKLLNAFRDHREWDYSLPESRGQSVVHIGAILTGSRLVNNYMYREKLIKDFKKYKPIGGEMEAQGVYSMARLYGVSEWIIIKGICDWGYKKDNPDKDKDQLIAASAAVDFCHHVFSRDGVFDPADFYDGSEVPDSGAGADAGAGTGATPDATPDAAPRVAQGTTMIQTGNNVVQIDCLSGNATFYMGGKKD